MIFKLKGMISAILAVLNIAVMAIPFFTIVILKIIIPIEQSKLFFTRILMPVARRFNLNNVAIFTMMGHIDWRVSGLEQARKDGHYLVIANHQSWTDILVLQAKVEGKVPFLKFFLKKELIWIPVLGAAWWALDFPFMKRHSREYLEKYPEKKGEDLAETRRMCAKFKHTPVSIMNFIEGTRFTPEKSAQQGSPYQNLLKPKVGGVALVINSMGRSVNTVLDVTIDYDVDGEVTLWKLYTGQVRAISVSCKEYAIPEQFFDRDYENDPEFKAAIQAWFHEIWLAKDEQLSINRKSEP